MKNNNNKKQNGFTLVEVLLIVLFISLTSLGIYMMQRKASEEVTINKEQEYIKHVS
jgi:Tfp pilus assembly protein PilV